MELVSPRERSGWGKTVVMARCGRSLEARGSGERTEGHVENSVRSPHAEMT